MLEDFLLSGAGSSVSLEQPYSSANRGIRGEIRTLMPAGFRGAQWNSRMSSADKQGCTLPKP